MTKKPFSSRMFKRLKDAHAQMEQVDQTVSRVVPVLQEAVAGNKKQLEALQTVLKSLEEYHSMVDAATSHMAELNTTSLKYELANVATFIAGMDVYFSAEPETVRGALNKFDLQVFEEQSVELEELRFNALDEAWQKAKNRRYHKKLVKQVEEDATRPEEDITSQEER